MATGLTRQYYPRGGQGTFVYSPDIAVFINTQQNGIIDLSPHIVDFNLSRVVNEVSSFTCTFDNKYAVFDRRIRRMDRIVVFLKRTSWVQVFSGYIVTAPWQTVVPGNATIQAECTLKRLKHSYFDPWSVETQEMFPFFNQETWEATSVDGGVAATIVRLLTQIAQWDMSQIQIQRIPSKWIQRAAKLLTKLNDAAAQDPDGTIDMIQTAMNNLLDALGWQGWRRGAKDWASDSNQFVPQTAGAGVGQYSDAQWFDKVGKTAIEMYPPNTGNVALTGGYIDTEHPELLFSLKVGGVEIQQKIESSNAALGKRLHLRLDAADGLAKLLDAFYNLKHTGYNIEFGYLTYDDAKILWNQSAQKKPAENADEGAWALYLKNGIRSGLTAPINGSPFLFGTAIKVTRSGALAKWLRENKSNHERFGWFQFNNDPLNFPDIYVFKGSPKYYDSTGRPKGQLEFDEKSTAAFKNLNGSGPLEVFGDNNIFSFMWYYPELDVQSALLTGTRAWINDVPLLDFIKKTCGASQRDFQSAPNGDFVAFFPDRLGLYSNFPSLRVRDIEIIDFKSVVNDASLTTHFISMGAPEVPVEGIDNVLNAWLNGSMLNIQQPDVLKFLLGLDEDAAADLGSQLVQMFGIRPRVEQNQYIRNRAYNFSIALHHFQQFWANQWKFAADFTFLPEIYPGMRIELVDRDPPLAVYVESVSHTGNRVSGFSTSVVVSTPTVLQNGKWVMMKPEIAPDSPLLPQSEKLSSDSGTNTGGILTDDPWLVNWLSGGSIRVPSGNDDGTSTGKPLP